MNQMSDLATVALWTLVSAWLVCGAIGAAHAIMYKRDPRSSTIWLFLNFALPILGPVVYWRFGINRIERKAVKLRGRRNPVLDEVPSENSHSDHSAIEHLQPLRRIAQRVTGLPLVAGNKITPLHHGEQAYPEMLSAIRKAEQTVVLESYIFDWDEIGREFADTLAQTAERGVRVHVLLDGVGAVGSFSRIGRRLVKSQAEVSSFFPVGLPFGRVRMNLRNHRKILVVDGKTGFTGGMNISTRHMVSEEKPKRVEDMHFKVEGPVVSQLQEAFIEDWFLATNKELTDDLYFQNPEPQGETLCRGITSGPDEHLEKIHLILQGALAAAFKSVRIMTPYFIPTSTLISAMVMAALRGVEITLILPSVLDLPLLKYATNAYLWQLLEHDIRVFWRPPPFAHTKLVVVDDRWLLLGSANWDRRSFRLNFEFNLEAYDQDLATRLGHGMDGVVKDLSPVTLEQMDARSPLQRLRDGTVKLFSPYL